MIDVRLKAARACEWAWCVATTARAPWVACRAYQAYGVRAAGSRQPPSRCVSASHYAHSAPALIYSLGACTPHHHLLTGSTHWLNSLAHSLPLYPLGSCTPHQTASHYTHLVPAFLITIYSLAQLTGSTHWLTASHSPLAPALLHHHSAIRAAGAQVRIVNTTIQ